MAAKNQVLHDISESLIVLHENLGLEKKKIETEMTKQKKLIHKLRRRNEILRKRNLPKDVLDSLKPGDKCSHSEKDKDDSGRESDSNDTIETLSQSAGKSESCEGGDNPCVNSEVMETNVEESKKIICYLTCYL